MRLAHSAALACLIAAAIAACDQPAHIVVDNKDDASYVAWVGDLGFIVPPKRRVDLVAFGWNDPYEPGDVQLFDANCTLVPGPSEPIFGTVHIDESSAAEFVEDHPGLADQADQAESSRFCMPEALMPSPPATGPEGAASPRSSVLP